jgi:phosphinothricin acetyltransferase
MAERNPMSENIIIRAAEHRDLLYLVDIYNYEVEHSTATLDINPQTSEQRHEWLIAHNVKNHPLIVAEADNKVVGYASLSPYREKEGYSCTVELSIYVSTNFRKHGVASILLASIIDLARKDPSIHTIISIITEGNEASANLHKKFGFSLCGTVKEAGYKFGRFIDIDQYQLLV